MNKTTRKIAILTVLAIFSISTWALADWDHGYDGSMMGQDGSGQGSHHRGEYGNNNNLSAEESAQMDQQRAEYFKATEKSRQKLYEKNLALRSELAKDNPDIAKASSLQSEISKLQGELDQKRLDYEIKARNTAPQYSGGYSGHGSMMGYNSRRGGNCMW